MVSVAERYLGRSIVIAVDDGSSDASATILASLEQELELLLLCRHETNAGYGAALRTGAQRRGGPGIRIRRIHRQRPHEPAGGSAEDRGARQPRAHVHQGFAVHLRGRNGISPVLEAGCLPMRGTPSVGGCSEPESGTSPTGFGRFAPTSSSLGLCGSGGSRSSWRNSTGPCGPTSNQWSSQPSSWRAKPISAARPSPIIPRRSIHISGIRCVPRCGAFERRRKPNEHIE